MYRRHSTCALVVPALSISRDHEPSLSSLPALPILPRARSVIAGFYDLYTESAPSFATFHAR